MAGVTLPADPNDPVVEELCGASSVQVELGRQTFVRLWNNYNFGVKTFQESVVASWQYPELRAETVSGAFGRGCMHVVWLTRTGQTIRRLASFIGDPREKAETICALHDGICRFGSAEDPGYRIFVKSLAGFITREEERVCAGIFLPSRNGLG
jgi:hypothetical protein